jgi:hypothetical protein
MKDERYSMSFTTGGLFPQESVNVVSLFLEQKDWNAVRENILSNNLLQARTLNTSKRICREIISRLKTLGSSELDLLAHGSSQEQGYLLWLSVCRRYRFIGDFALEVLRERYISLKTDLQYEDFESFFDGKAEYHPELDKIRPTTRKKLRQVLFNMMREADLLTHTNSIIPAMLSPSILTAIPHEKREDVSFFPAFESDIKGMTR